jgi:hypothetical protein
MPMRMTDEGRLAALARLYRDLVACRRCPGMQGPPVHGEAVISPVMMVGQAPGTREILQGIPFCWTAGKTLFRWFESIGVDEPTFRRRVLMSAVCRCFPGKNPKGGDRVPDAVEVERCSGWWQGELELARPVDHPGRQACHHPVHGVQAAERGGGSPVALSLSDRSGGRPHPAPASLGRLDLVQDGAGHDRPITRICVA